MISGWKPTRGYLCGFYGVSVLDLARRGNIHPLTIWDMLPGYEVMREDAHLILCAFNELRGTSFTVDDILGNDTYCFLGGPG